MSKSDPDNSSIKPNIYELNNDKITEYVEIFNNKIINDIPYEFITYLQQLVKPNDNENTTLYNLITSNEEIRIDKMNKVNLTDIIKFIKDIKLHFLKIDCINNDVNFCKEYKQAIIDVFEGYLNHIKIYKYFISKSIDKLQFFSTDNENIKIQYLDTHNIKLIDLFQPNLLY
jgi:hypothetical protein